MTLNLLELQRFELESQLQVSVITLILFKHQRSIDNSIDYILSCCEKVHDNKEFSREN